MILLTGKRREHGQGQRRPANERAAGRRTLRRWQLLQADPAGFFFARTGPKLGSFWAWSASGAGAGSVAGGGGVRGAGTGSRAAGAGTRPGEVMAGGGCCALFGASPIDLARVSGNAG